MCVSNWRVHGNKMVGIGRSGIMRTCMNLTIVSLFVSATLIDCLKIAAFNIQIFGKSKAGKSEVMDVLVKIISRYDIVLIQEIRDSSGTAINDLLSQTNAKNPSKPFSMKISGRLGRTTSKEQYAYFYRPSSGLEVVRDYTYNDGDESKNTDVVTVDTFEREPYIVLFESSSTVMKRFAIAGIHVDPDKAFEEIKALGDVFDDIKEKLKVKDIMIMGDFNADCSYLPNYRWKDIPLKHDTEYTWLIGDQEDTTVSKTNCAYDRFVVTGPEFSSAKNGGLVQESAKVFKFDSEYGLTPEEAILVSDHYPIELELKDVTSCSGAHLLAFVLVVFVCLVQVL